MEKGGEGPGQREWVKEGARQGEGHRDKIRHRDERAGGRLWGRDRRERESMNVQQREGERRAPTWA